MSKFQVIIEDLDDGTVVVSTEAEKFMLNESDVTAGQKLFCAVVDFLEGIPGGVVISDSDSTVAH